MNNTEKYIADTLKITISTKFSKIENHLHKEILVVFKETGPDSWTKKESTTVSKLKRTLVLRNGRH